MGNKQKMLDASTLFAQLWEAANILRGPVDAADFKTYIFPLLFFKRLSDVYDDEYAVGLAESDGDVEYASFPENHRFLVPENCHWQDIREKSRNIGHALQNAMRGIEQANPDTLHGAEDFHIERGDTLRLPAFYSGDSLATFDCVIANPPFSLEKWGDDVWINDPYGRNFAGRPPAKSGDFAWVQHMIKSMARKTGRAQNELLPEHVDNIHRWYEGNQDEEGICRVVTLDEIRENDFNLNIPRYVEPVIEEESMTIDQAIANLKESLQVAYAAEDKLKTHLKQNGLLS